ncbi:hypothetical protein Ait01nite_068460 [Actinoplanes italicus]|nr:hypothetical protein Ait01nite_068460 [Actinoplanes italicus]
MHDGEHGTTGGGAKDAATGYREHGGLLGSGWGNGELRLCYAQNVIDNKARVKVFPSD